MQQNQKIANLLWNFMRDDGQGSHHPEIEIGQESRRDQHAIDEIMKGVAHGNHQAAATVVMAMRMSVAE